MTSTSFGIHEWYGNIVQDLGVAERQALARRALEHYREKQDAVRDPCPFHASVAPGASCNKPGGVCSIQPLMKSHGHVSPVPHAVPAVTCPQRFWGDRLKLLRWIAKTILGSSSVLAVKETPFLRRLGDEVADSDDRNTAGRIDWLLIDTKSPDNKVAVEIQSLYFSGHNMGDDIQRYVGSSGLVFPARPRRPDYRSGGPKRLAPQLRVKVPALADLGIGTAVLVDRYFHQQMAQGILSGTPASTEGLHNLTWFVAEYQVGGGLGPSEIAYASLDESVLAMDAVRPMERREFDANLGVTLRKPSNQGTKVFTLC